MGNEDIKTSKEQMESLEKQFDNFKKDTQETIQFRPNDAVVLHPSLGNPAVVKREGNKACLELLILCKTDDLQRGEAAFHLRISPWMNKDHGSSCLDDCIIQQYLEIKRSSAADKDAESKVNKFISLSSVYKIDKDMFGNGSDGPDKGKDTFSIRLGHNNLFPWIIQSLSQYPYLYKIRIDLGFKPDGMFNIWWVNNADYHEVRNRPKWWNLVQHIKDLSNGVYKMPLPFKKELKEYGGDVVDHPKKEKNENVQASIYHPVYIMSKDMLTIGHVTDIHLDSRMEVYGQCEASVIEIEENCPPKADGDKRKLENDTFHISIKKKIANFNEIFTNICEQLIRKGADALVITGDLVDYNRGIHTKQTHKKCFTPISEVWEALSSNVAKEEHYRDDRNWFLFYKKLLELYDRKNSVPVFTMLGNHDYVNYGMAPWPLGGLPWNGVFDQNLTLYESALSFGEGYNSSKAFVKDVKEKSEYVEWYTIFINPFMDYVVNYGDLSLCMVDWGVKSNIASSVIQGSGGLHHARHLFTKKSDHDRVISNGGESEPIVTNSEPYPIRNYSIYESWIKQDDKVKILFMHATGLCPRDDVSIGQINHDLKWTKRKMKFGSFDNRHTEIIQDVENGKLNMIVAGHSHRNVVMEVDKSHPYEAKVIGAGETYGSIKRPAQNIVMVTSSGGPLPKYLPGGPLICKCADKYDEGWDYDKRFLRKNEFYEYTSDGQKKDLSNVIPPGETKVIHKCPTCQMLAKNMGDKKAKRHRPGGSLISFENGNGKTPQVVIESVPSNLPSSTPRRGVMSDEYKVLTQSMRFEKIDNYEDYHYWKKKIPINIISRFPFKRYGYMNFPNQVQYITFKKGNNNLKGLRGENSRMAKTHKDFSDKYNFRQEIVKDDFDSLLTAASSDEDFAFSRYVFNSSPVESWDREIKMYQLSDGLNEGYQNFTYNGANVDKIKGLVMAFIRKPNHKKRKKVCGY